MNSHLRPIRVHQNSFLILSKLSSPPRFNSLLRALVVAVSSFNQCLEVSGYRGPLMFEVGCGERLQQAVRDVQESVNRLMRYNSKLGNELNINGAINGFVRKR